MDINSITKDPIVIEFDRSNPNWTVNPEYNKVFLRAVLVQAIDRFHAQGHLFVNEFLDMLGHPRMCAGQLLGWHIEDRDTGMAEFGLMADGKLLVRIYPGNIIWDRIEVKP